jgi:predicted anti-sigma-YlaC factor YlaD
MDCRKVYRHICENLDEDLDSRRCREIKKHLQACPHCQAYLDSVKKTVTLYRELESPPLSLRSRRKLIKVISLEMKSPPARHRAERGTRPAR